MTLTVELYWSFRSPYSYLATPRLVALARDHDVEIDVRPVLPLAIRKPEFFEQVHPQWIPYLLRDTKRVADMEGLPYRWPRPDPVAMDRATGKPALDQPFIRRLTRLGVAAAQAGRGLAFLREASHVIWSGEIDNWHDGDHLARAAGRSGLDLSSLDRAIATDPAVFDARIEANQKAQEGAGHWGVPLMAFKGEPFFGQDRIDALIWRLKQHGLAKRG
ncbi:MAG: 2-hydroxychromene-2-carboxylate isomerase [Alphaproteobacteria bacterium]|nr:2-hydroxychromene-2-carboxylate isomerase [Alphaproteobacteria bacterium]